MVVLFLDSGVGWGEEVGRGRRERKEGGGGGGGGGGHSNDKIANVKETFSCFCF